MDAALELRIARRRAGLSQRALATRAGTSQATLSAYEAGRKVPTLAVLDRLLTAAGAELAVGRPPREPAELEQAGRHLVAVLELAEALPFRRDGELAFPRLPAAA